MRIVHDYPPNFAAIAKVFPAANNFGVIFTYGDAIYAPTDSSFPGWILQHERARSARQGADPEGWWKRYLEEPKFRFDEELVAHRVEWCAWLIAGRGVRNRLARRGMMDKIAGRLAGPLYGRMVTFAEAKRLILQGVADAADQVAASRGGTADAAGADAPMAPM